jgi:hypothetical protein
VTSHISPERVKERLAPPVEEIITVGFGCRLASSYFENSTTQP